MYRFRTVCALSLVGLALAFSAFAQQPPSAVTLTSSKNPSSFGLPIMLTATDTPTSATGKVTFYSGTDVLGTLHVTAVQAVLSSPLLPFGPQSLYAYHSGNASLGASKSSLLKQTVNAIAGYGFQLPVSYPVVANAVTAGDFGGDGKPDLAFASYETNNASVLLGNGDGTFQPPTVFPAGGDPVTIVAGEVNLFRCWSPI